MGAMTDLIWTSDEVICCLVCLIADTSRLIYHWYFYHLVCHSKVLLRFLPIFSDIVHRQVNT
jgi:hypothetical protein